MRESADELTELGGKLDAALGAAEAEYAILAQDPSTDAAALTNAREAIDYYKEELSTFRQTATETYNEAERIEQRIGGSADPSAGTTRSAGTVPWGDDEEDFVDLIFGGYTPPVETEIPDETPPGETPPDETPPVETKPPKSPPGGKDTGEIKDETPIEQSTPPRADKPKPNKETKALADVGPIARMIGNATEALQRAIAKWNPD